MCPDDDFQANEHVWQLWLNHRQQYPYTFWLLARLLNTKLKQTHQINSNMVSFSTDLLLTRWTIRWLLIWALKKVSSKKVSRTRKRNGCYDKKSKVEKTPNKPHNKKKESNENLFDSWLAHLYVCCWVLPFSVHYLFVLASLSSLSLSIQRTCDAFSIVFRCSVYQSGLEHCFFI